MEGQLTQKQMPVEHPVHRIKQVWGKKKHVIMFYYKINIFYMLKTSHDSLTVSNLQISKQYEDNSQEAQ